jgi:hypothetical protein
MWNVEARLVWSHGIFCKTAVFCSKRMKTCYMVTGFEFIDVLSNGMDNAGNVITAVVGQVLPMQNVSIKTLS